MRDDMMGPPEEPGDRIVLVSVQDAYWLLEGEQHLKAMLSGLSPFPVPVRCITFETAFDLNLFLPDDTPVSGLWGINPLIIERLRRDEVLLETKVDQ
ncbi:MAG: hypothetical protein AAF713_16745 [Pseudomonadota bacterium]